MEKDVGVDVLNWSFSSEAYLNIIAPPYSSAKILFLAIKSYLEKRKRILYVTDENFNEIEIVELLKTKPDKNYIVNVSRGIIYKSKEVDFAVAAKSEIIKYNKTFSEVLF